MSDIDEQGATAAADRPAERPAFVERRKSDRRGMDALRAEALQNLMSQVEDRNFGGLRGAAMAPDRPARPRLNPRLLLVAVAIVAGGLAAFLAVQQNAPAPAPVAQPETIVEYVPEARTRILVATQAIGVGQRVGAATIGWGDWPADAVAPEYVSEETEPEALAALEGQVARAEFVAGEPIRPQKLSPPNQGFLSTVIGSGKRAVSVMVAAESASGGFIVPGDFVDVVLTRGSERGQVSDTILNGVKVMAINGKLTTSETEESEVHPEVFGGQAIATLELDPSQGEIIINAATAGKLSLVLRASADGMAGDSARALSVNQSIRLTSPFWTR